MLLSSHSSGRGLRPLVVLLFVAALVFVPSAGASHSFTDVPDGHPFHNEIGVFKDTNITAGKTCDPPGAPPTFCPNDNVERQAMAAFFTRALGLVVRPGESTQKGVPGSRVEMIDDDVSFVGTNAGALELSLGGVRGLRIESFGGHSSVIGGSGSNGATAGAQGATVSGGIDNSVTDVGGSVGGGQSNRAGDNAGTPNDSLFSTVSGGNSNAASGAAATVGGGTANTASGVQATVAGGVGNEASGVNAMVPGGFDSAATGDYSFAAGVQAKADDQGAFMWADSQGPPVFSAGVNTFNVRAGGGIWLGTLSGTQPTIPMGTFLNTSTGGHLTTGGAWTNASDRALKQDFAEVDGRAILRALALMPIQSWSYKAEPGVRHVGPVAQDFERAFGLGRGNEHIATVDADGVALAAIQALHRENLALARKNRALGRRLAALERVVSQLAKRR